MRVLEQSILSIVLLPGFFVAAYINAQAEDTAAITPVAMQAISAANNPGTQTYSPGVTEVLKLLDAKVSTDVIKAYIKNSSAAYDLSAQQVVALNERGVPDDIVTAMMQRARELRGQTTQSAGATPNAPAYTGVPAVTVDPYAYYGYPSYWSGYPYDYSYWWDYSTWPDFFPYGGFAFYNFGRRPFRHGDFLHGRDFGRINRSFAPNGSIIHSPLGTPPMLHGFSGMGLPGTTRGFSGTQGPTGSFGGRSGSSAFGFHGGMGGHPGGRR